MSSTSRATSPAQKECIARVLQRLAVSKVSRMNPNQQWGRQKNLPGSFPTATSPTTKESALSVTLPALARWRRQHQQQRHPTSGSGSSSSSSTAAVVTDEGFPKEFESSKQALEEQAEIRQVFIRTAAKCWGNFVTGRNLNLGGEPHPLLSSPRFQKEFRPRLLHPSAMAVVEKALTHASYLHELEGLVIQHALPWEKYGGLDLGLKQRRTAPLFSTTRNPNRMKALGEEVDLLSLNALGQIGATTSKLSLHSAMGWQVFVGAAPSIALSQDLRRRRTSITSTTRNDPPLFLLLDKNDVSDCLATEKEAATAELRDALAAMTDKCGLGRVLLTGGAIKQQLTSLGLYDVAPATSPPPPDVSASATDPSVLLSSPPSLTPEEKLALVRMKAVIGTAVIGAAQSLAGYEAAFLLFNAHALPMLEQSLLHTDPVPFAPDFEKRAPGVRQL